MGTKQRSSVSSRFLVILLVLSVATYLSCGHKDDAEKKIGKEVSNQSGDLLAQNSGQIQSDNFMGQAEAADSMLSQKANEQEQGIGQAEEQGKLDVVSGQKSLIDEYLSEIKPGYEIISAFYYKDCADGQCVQLDCTSDASILTNQSDYTSNDGEPVIGDRCMLSRNNLLKLTDMGLEIETPEYVNTRIGVSINSSLLKTGSSVEIYAEIFIPENSQVLPVCGFTASSLNAKTNENYEETDRHVNARYQSFEKGKVIVVKMDSREDICSEKENLCGLSATVPNGKPFISAWLEFLGGWDCAGGCAPMGGSGKAYVREIVVVGMRADYVEISLTTKSGSMIYELYTDAVCSTGMYECTNGMYYDKTMPIARNYYVPTGGTYIINAMVSPDGTWCNPEGDTLIANGVELTKFVPHTPFDGGYDIEVSINENGHVMP